METRLKGMGVALITPFKEDGSVDYDALLRLVDYQLENGTDFLCVLGTTAETPTLTKEEKEKVKRTVIDRVNGRLPILLGVGSNSTQALQFEIVVRVHYPHKVPLNIEPTPLDFLLCSFITSKTNLKIQIWKLKNFDNRFLKLMFSKLFYKLWMLFF